MLKTHPVSSTSQAAGVFLVRGTLIRLIRAHRRQKVENGGYCLRMANIASIKEVGVRIGQERACGPDSVGRCVRALANHRH